MKSTLFFLLFTCSITGYKFDTFQKGKINPSLESDLIEAVLNLPRVMKFSKTEIVKLKFECVNVYIQSDVKQMLNNDIRQAGMSVNIVLSLEGIDVVKEPCYVFEKLNISNDKATVLVGFDLTGAIVSGSFELIDGNWIPDENIVIGVR